MNGYARILLAFAIAFAFVAMAVSLPAEKADAASSGSCGDGVAWSFEGNTPSITYTGTGTGKMDDHKDPKEFGYASLWESINNVVIGEGVTYIGESAFQTSK